MTLGFQKHQIKIPAWVIPVVGYVISIAALIWVLHGVDATQLIERVTSLHWGWISLAVAVDIGIYVYQAGRWNLLLSPVVQVPMWRSVQAIYVGLFANEILPLRPGELVRAYLQARWSKIPFSVAFSSVIIERVFDGLWLVAAFSLAAAFLKLPPEVTLGAQILAGVVVVCVILLGLVMFRKHHAHAACAKTRWGEKLRVLVEDLHLMGNSRSFYLAAAASLPYLLFQVVPIYALMRAFNLDLTLWPALVVLVIFRLGTVPPGLPGNIGPSQAALVLALGLFGIDKTTAAAYSFVTWGVITLPLLVAGFIALTWTEMNLADIRYHAKKHMASPPVAAQH